jgi:hypothetical protein
MRGKVTFLAGAAVGFVLGTRAGRERYEEIMRTTRKMLDSPSVHEATGVVQSKASKIYESGKGSLGNSRLRHPMGRSNDDMDVDDLLDETNRQRMSTNSF